MLGNAAITPTVAVKDIEAAKKFYGEVLGLELKDENPGGVTYQAGKSMIFVYPSQYAGSNQATYASFSVDDLEGTVADLEAKGVAFEQYDNLPGTTREGSIHTMGEWKTAWFKDPDGNIFAIDSNPHEQ